MVAADSEWYKFFFAAAASLARAVRADSGEPEVYADLDCLITDMADAAQSAKAASAKASRKDLADPVSLPTAEAGKFSDIWQQGSGLADGVGNGILPHSPLLEPSEIRAISK
eukprot:8116436-Pyramimonas_sp.AAC.1